MISPMRNTIAMLLLCTSLTLHARGPALLIVSFENSSGSTRYHDLAGGMPDILTACFSRFADQIAVIERASLTRAIEELGLSRLANIDPATQQRAGAIVGADIIVRGSFTMTGGVLKAEALAFNVTDTTLAAAARADLERGTIIEQVCNELAAPLVTALLKSTPHSTPVADDHREQALMMAGLSHFYTGDYTAAITPFLKLIRAAPDNESAHFWLGRSFAGAGLEGLAVVQMNTYLEHFPASPRRGDVALLLETLLSGAKEGQ